MRRKSVFRLERGFREVKRSFALHARKKTAFALLIAFAVGAFACAPVVHVSSASDPGASFSEHRSVAMLQPNRPVHTANTKVDPFVLQRYRQHVYLALKKKGYLPATKEDADLIVAVVVGQDEQVDVYSNGGYGYGYGYHPWMGPSSSHLVVRSERQILVIDIIERKTKSVIWRGTGERELNSGLSDLEQREMVEAVLAEYPNVAAKE